MQNLPFFNKKVMKTQGKKPVLKTKEKKRLKEKCNNALLEKFLLTIMRIITVRKIYLFRIEDWSYIWHTGEALGKN